MGHLSLWHVCVCMWVHAYGEFGEQRVRVEIQLLIPGRRSQIRWVSQSEVTPDKRQQGKLRVMSSHREKDEDTKETGKRKFPVLDKS